MRRYGLTTLFAIALLWGCATRVQQDVQTPEPEDNPPVQPVFEGKKADDTKADETDDTKVEEVDPEAPSTEAVVQDNNDFALDLFRQLSSKEGNLFFSPYSVSAAMAMTYGGARNKTEKQIAYALHFAHPPGKLHERFASLQGEFDKIEEVKLRIANALWPSDNFTFKDAYLNLIKDNYDTPITYLDFDGSLDKSRKTINKWAKKKTEGKIKELIEKGKIDKLTRLVLTNAIYFKGNWHTQFDKKNTKKMPFKVTADKSVKTKMMYMKHKLPYYEDDTVQVVQMPYAGNEVAMMVVLPKQADGLGEVAKALNGEKLTQIVDKLAPTQVELYFPRFELDSSFELEEQLKAMGAIDAFDGTAADFSGMADEAEMKDKGNLFISAVIHKAYTKVNEKGTEAAASTAVVVRSYAAATPKIVADHPFAFLIREVNSNAIFFAGRVVNPKEK